MKKTRKKNQSSDSLVLGIGWYKEEQWDLLLKHAIDKDNLESTYAEWIEGISEGIKNFAKSGVKCQKIPVDVNEMIEWCRKNDYPFDGDSRATFISLKTKEYFS